MGRKSKRRLEIEAMYGPDAPDDIEYWDELARQVRIENGEYDDDDDDGVPECCRACGGNYPDCTDSCKIFDD